MNLSPVTYSAVLHDHFTLNGKLSVKHLYCENDPLKESTDLSDYVERLISQSRDAKKEHSRPL